MAGLELPIAAVELPRRLPLRVRPKPDASLSACALSPTPLPVRLQRSSSLAPVFLFPMLLRSLLLPLQLQNLQEGSGSVVEMGRKDWSILCTSKQ
jgi:hypothetical protein